MIELSLLCSTILWYIRFSYAIANFIVYKTSSKKINDSREIYCILCIYCELETFFKSIKIIMKITLSKCQPKQIKYEESNDNI